VFLFWTVVAAVHERAAAYTQVTHTVSRDTKVTLACMIESTETHPETHDSDWA
jgi:hypothetical protein